MQQVKRFESLFLMYGIFAVKRQTKSNSDLPISNLFRNNSKYVGYFLDFKAKLAFFWAHEDEFVAPASPGGLDMFGPGDMVLRAGHHPAQHPHTLVQVTRHALVICNRWWTLGDQ